jgi:hypothetical protein
MQFMSRAKCSCSVRTNGNALAFLEFEAKIVGTVYQHNHQIFPADVVLCDGVASPDDLPINSPGTRL